MAIGLVALTACGGTVTKQHRTTVGVLWNPGYGWIVVGPSHHALYMFCIERPLHCPDGHDPNYAPLLAEGPVLAGPAATRSGAGKPLQIAADQLGTIRLDDGERQVTYFGNRLYVNRNDHRPGNVDINGEHYVKQERGFWTLIGAGAGRIALSTTY